jgi:hypothetical protein
MLSSAFMCIPTSTVSPIAAWSSVWTRGMRIPPPKSSTPDKSDMVLLAISKAL